MSELVTFSSGIADPQPTPARAPGSIRRTSHIDITFVGDELHLVGASRDFITGESPAVRAEATVIAELGRDHRLRRLTATGGEIDASQLVGTIVGSGFRARIDPAMPATATGSPLFALLDELPVAAVISGYSRMYEAGHDDQRGAAAQMADVCSGWRSEGLMIRSIKATGRMPVPFGPPAPPAETGDELAWHHLPRIPVGGMRRRRLIDVTPDITGFEVFATFRDAHVNTDGIERVLHEYTLAATLGTDGRITASTATPRGAAVERVPARRRQCRSPGGGAPRRDPGDDAGRSGPGHLPASQRSAPLPRGPWRPGRPHRHLTR